ncbi:ArsA family ATPase [Bacillus sp. ISL-37]|jgi:arsenite/tail-anchored protein-transporting ATPase|uniref:ArsA family ATPase n=1 Tax=Bacillus sp. ISL-37 TaxID=2819123 RepID=UPI001BE9E7CE|nr:ArsA family ATPase [Bacillus sp. ISL-37]MBT2682464.1 ArsA family ATPase [Bacillus sp. ISL-37]
MDMLEKKIYFIGGKGGVGKSTTSAAMALLLAQKGKKILLVSTDPAHNTGDLFHRNLSGGKIERATENLDVLEIDSEQESRNYINGVKGNLKGLVKATMLEEVNRQIDMAASSPGAEEAALFDKITSLILEEIANYDGIVFDTAPTGHTIRLLTLPELMGVWMDGLLERRKKVNENYAQWMNDGEIVEDPLYEKLNERKNRFKRVREILLDDTKTQYVFVLNAERLPILETAKAIDTLHEHGIHVNSIVVNKVIPDEADGRFMEQRRTNERVYLDEIKDKFKNQRQIFLPLLEHDISSLATLELISGLLGKQIDYHLNHR